ncbi:MAG: Serine/threonine-protein kinase pkn3 [Labilithrix sp.]|nr:Serine/threonine-protein kinase pkn3 [Labilithrix sp.]
MWDNHGVFELSAGQIVADKYRIDGIMGTGGMGVVVAATHVELDQRVAIKFLREVSPEALARFQREARLLVRLKSPHVARVFDVGALDDDTPYIVMEHLEGNDLATVVSTRKKLPVEETVDYVLQACEALAEAHGLGMVHRDLKPANLFLARGPGGTTTVKVLDFGVSKILDDRSQGASDRARGGDLTNEGVALGSPGYMSPEQMTSARDVDERSDIFSLGALLYRMVAGQTPYKGSSVVSILASMATEKLTPVRRLSPDVPEAFGAIVERCLAQDKALRYPTVAHLAHALVPYATRRGRVIIEQILATLNVTFPDDGLGDTMVRAVVAPAATPRNVPSGIPPAPLSGPPALGPAMQTGPHFTVSAPLATPRMLGGPRPPSPGRSLPQMATIGVTLVVLLLVGAVAAWRALRTPPVRTPDDDAQRARASASATTPSATTAPASEPAVPSIVTAAPTATSPVVAPEPTTRPRGTPTPLVRPRATPTAHASGARTSGSAPPNPADVPGGRH